VNGYLAIDMSSWGERFTDSEAEAAKVAGACLNIVNTWGEWARQQADMALAHGMAFEPYEYMYLSIDPVARIKRGLDALYGFPRDGIWWLDYEDEAVGFSKAAIVAHIRQGVAFCESQGLRPGIYSRREWWQRRTGGSVDFMHLPSWVADYDGIPDLVSASPLVDGWHVTMKQYAGTSQLGGQSVDLNWREDDMSEADKIELYVLRVLKGVSEALAQGRLQDASNAMAKYLGVRPKV